MSANTNSSYDFFCTTGFVFSHLFNREFFLDDYQGYSLDAPCFITAGSVISVGDNCLSSIFHREG